MKRGGLWVLGIVVLVAVGGGGWRLIRGPLQSDAATQPAPPPAVPVTVTSVKAQDVPIFLDGLGAVQAFNTVEVKAQVNGVLLALPAPEGQEVHKGDIVARDRPRALQGGAGSGRRAAGRG